VASAIYRVAGMSCEHCVRAVSQELRDMPGVRDVAIQLSPGGESAVTVTSGAPLRAVAAALDAAGNYQLR
jgi:copper chaperone